MVGLIASLLPKKEEKEAETVKVEVVSETPAKPAAKKKPVAKKKPLKDLQDLPEDLVPGTA